MGDDAVGIVVKAHVHCAVFQFLKPLYLSTKMCKGALCKGEGFS